MIANRKGNLSLARGRGAYTLFELLIVVTIIVILAGLSLQSIKYAKNKGASSKTIGVVKMIELALEKYHLCAIELVESHR